MRVGRMTTAIKSREDVGSLSSLEKVRPVKWSLKKNWPR